MINAVIPLYEQLAEHQSSGTSPRGLPLRPERMCPAERQEGGDHSGRLAQPAPGRAGHLANFCHRCLVLPLRHQQPAICGTHREQQFKILAIT